MKKYLLISGATALCLAGVMFVAQADNDAPVREYREDSYERRHRGPVKATIDGAADVVSGTARGTANVIGNIFGGGRNRHNNDNRSDLRSSRDDNRN